MLSDKISHRQITKRKKPGTLKWWSDAQKLECVKLWLITGNLTHTAAALNIPLVTVKSWKSQKWWKELADEIKTEGTIQLSQRLKGVAEKALDCTLDRLENGDFQYDPKSGEMIRKPVLMRDAHRVASDLLGKHLELEKKPFEEEAMKATQDRLEALAKTFAGFAKKVKRIEVMDVEYRDAIQIESPERVDVREQTGNGEALAEGNSEGEEAPQTCQEVTVSSSQSELGGDGETKELTGQSEKAIT